MESYKKSSKKITLFMFIIYLAIITWIIVFKMQIPKELGFIRSINLLPYSQPLITNGVISIKEMIYNMILFIPVGLYICLLCKKLKKYKKIIIVICISLAFETAQYALGVGASDITDLINNTIGGAAGILVYRAVSKLLGEKTDRALNIISVAATCAVLLFMVAVNIMAY